MGAGKRFPKGQQWFETWLEAERGQLILWLPIAFGAGIAGWFALAGPRAWIGLLALALGSALVGALLPGRAGRALLLGGVAVALGCGAIWIRATSVAAPVLARPVAVAFDAAVEAIEPLPAREMTRLLLRPTARGDLPLRLRVNVAQGDLSAGVRPGARIALRARLVPPPPAAVPGAYDFRRAAWFSGIGATGKALGPVTVLQPGTGGAGELRTRLTAHIQAQLPGSAGGIASALATGDEGAIDVADAEAMRRAGLAHLLSVSGLHVTAVTGAAMLIVLRLLALSPALALRWRLPLVAAAAGAVAAIGYTWLTGSQVPTIRSCVAALLVLAALSLGREALTLRLVAAGAMVVLALWPEALVGPSFQLSFAAVTAIVALHESPRVRRWFEPREQEGRVARLLRGTASLLLTGVLVELALMPIGLYHFHKAGLYGALANIVAIPLTTFVVMPIEALALLFDLVGLGAPLWWLAGKALALLLLLAHAVAAAPGSVAALPAMPAGAFALMVLGGLWLALWRSSVRAAGLALVAVGAGWALLSPAPDLLVTGDGRHVALRMGDGRLALLRDRTGDYMRATLGENSGTVEAGLALLTNRNEARCSADACIVELVRGGRRWRIAATRSAYPIGWAAMVALCARSDIVVSDRRLPRACTPRWLKLDRPALARSGGVAIGLEGPFVRTVEVRGQQPWLDPPRVLPPMLAGRREGP